MSNFYLKCINYYFFSENEGLRASIEEQNEVAAEIYQKDVSDHEEAIEALLQVKSLLESSTLYSNEALVEKIQDSNILSLSSTNAVRTTMVNKLLQLSQDPKDLALLMELIDQLLNDLRNALGRIQANEAIRTSQVNEFLNYFWRG